MLGSLALTLQYSYWRHLRIVIFLGGMGAMLWMALTFGSYQPGIRYHLGLRSLSEYYKTMNLPMGTWGASEVLKALKPEGKIAVFGEYPHLISHPAAFSVNISLELDRNFRDTEDFMETLTKKGVQYLVITKGTLSFVQTNNPTGWIAQSLREGRLKIVNNDPAVALLLNPDFKVH